MMTANADAATFIIIKMHFAAEVKKWYKGTLFPHYLIFGNVTDR